MNFVEIVRGIGNVGFVMLIAGGVAYVGDRVGHQVGRRRLSLFGIRPRYTSTIIAIGTGMVIALVVTLVAIFASQQVKTAFFKLNSINQQITELSAAGARAGNEGQYRSFDRAGRRADGAVLSDRRSVGVVEVAARDDSRRFISTR